MKPQDIEDLKQLIEFLKSYQVAEFDLDRGDVKIRLKFNPPEGTPSEVGELARLLASAPPAVAQAAAAAQTTAPAAAEADPDAGLHVVKSPIVGTFYGSPSPAPGPLSRQVNAWRRDRSLPSSRP